MIREEFPQIEEGTVYFDSAASSLKPQCMIDAIQNFYSHSYSTVHRSVYGLAQKNTAKYEEAREQVAQFIHAKSAKEIVFTKNTTEAINLIAYSLQNQLAEGDEIVLTKIEHHANLVIWQLIAKKTGAILKFVKVDEEGHIDLEDLEKQCTSKTKIATFSYASNVFSTLQPVENIVQVCKQKGITVIIDGAQTPSFLPIDVQKLNVDFFCFSAHKVYGPTGLGILWGRYELLDAMPPFLAGGDMIQEVNEKEASFHAPPLKFEAGTPPIAEVLAFKAVIDWMNGIGIDTFFAHAQTLRKKALEELQLIEGLYLVNHDLLGAPLLSFYFEDVHPLDIASLMDEKGFQFRTGHLCAMPAIHHTKQPYLSRISFGIYNTEEEILRFRTALEKTLHQLRKFQSTGV